MNWYLVYIDGPALLNGTFHHDSRRLACGLFADNAKQARERAAVMCPIERCDEYHIVRDDSPNGDRAYGAQIEWFRAEDDFRELMDAVMENDK